MRLPSLRVLISTACWVLLVAFADAPSIAQQGPDEWESNDTRRNANPIDGFEIRGEIGDRHGEDDWFYLEGQEGDYPSFLFDPYPSARGGIAYEIYDDYDLVWQSHSRFGHFGPSREYGSRLSFRIEATCYIHVNCSGERTEYMIDIAPGSCSGPDESEPNGRRQDADSITELEIEGFICDDEEDWFVLEGEQGSHMTFTINSEADCNLNIYDDSDLIGESESWGGV